MVRLQRHSAQFGREQQKQQETCRGVNCESCHLILITLQVVVAIPAEPDFVAIMRCRDQLSLQWYNAGEMARSLRISAKVVARITGSMLIDDRENQLDTESAKDTQQERRLSDGYRLDYRCDLALKLSHTKSSYS